MGIHQIPFTERHRNPPLVTIDRARLEALIADAIDVLDMIDGDPDLEPEEDQCQASDDGCGPIERDARVQWGSPYDEEDSCEAADDGCGSFYRHGQVVWGSQEDEHNSAPDYGIDQTRQRWWTPEWMK